MSAADKPKNTVNYLLGTITYPLQVFCESLRTECTKTISKYRDRASDHRQSKPSGQCTAAARHRAGVGMRRLRLSGSWIGGARQHHAGPLYLLPFPGASGRSVDLGRAGDECTPGPATTTPEERRINDAHDRLL